MEKKIAYRVQNWKDYNRSLINRGNLTIWFSEDAIKSWYQTDLVIDSTGLKIFGEGEWKMRTHGKQKRRTWRKYHVSVNPATHEVTAIELTEANVHDCTFKRYGMPAVE